MNPARVRPATNVDVSNVRGASSRPHAPDSAHGRKAVPASSKRPTRPGTPSVVGGGGAAKPATDCDGAPHRSGFARQPLSAFFFARPIHQLQLRMDGADSGLYAVLGGQERPQFLQCDVVLLDELAPQDVLEGGELAWKVAALGPGAFFSGRSPPLQCLVDVRH